MAAFLEIDTCAIWVVDIQEKLFGKMECAPELLERICFILDVAKILKLPLFVTEQNPLGLGQTIRPVKERLPQTQTIFTKTSFSGWHDPSVRIAAENIGSRHWILVGIETHVCVFQTAKDLVNSGKDVTILNDSVGSRLQIDHLTAIDEMRHLKIRISTAETVVYELIRDAKRPAFKEILPLIKRG